ncbi:MAG: sulfite oxidase, partial [Dehalococcoidia bacterium]
MSPRATNLALLVLLTAELVSGLAGFVVGAPSGRWVFWLHGVGGFALVLLLAWKWRIVVRSFARRGAGPWAFAPAALGVCFLGALFTGLAWSTV